jgi:hypothetical protein
MNPAASTKPGTEHNNDQGKDQEGVRDVVTQGDEYLRPRQEQARDRALDPAETSGAVTAPDEADLPALTPGSSSAASSTPSPTPTLTPSKETP